MIRTCSIEGCGRKHEARGFCSKHYQRFKASPEFGAPSCKMDGCEKPAWSRGWCQAHYQRWHATGSPTGRKRPRADCTVEGCTSKAEAHGLCKMHVSRLRRTGTTDPYVPISDRLDAFVDKTDPNACWEWRGPRNNRGYGKIGLLYAHRVACERAYGPPPDGRPFVLHACDNPPCINPAHLSWGTASQNGIERWQRTGKRRAS